MELFKLVGTIVIKADDAINGMNRTSEEAKKAHEKIEKSFDKIGKAAKKVGKAIAAGLAAGATAMGKLVLDSLNLAGELEQNMGGSEAVFGEYAQKMQDTASQAFKNMGLSTSDFLATANKMGALFQGAGFGIEESANLSAEAMQRAADVASIMGIDTASAMEAIAGAAKGNFTMMDNLGVAMNDTTLQAYALEKGITKSTQSMTNQEKIGLAMEMFLDKTSYAAGNYAKENETLAGSLSTAKAALSNFLSGAGTVDDLVGALVNAGEVILENLNTLLPRLVEGLTSLVEQLMPYLPALLEELLPALIDGAIVLVNGLIAALPTLLQIIIAELPNIIVQLTTALIQVFPALLQTVKNLFGQIWDYIAVELLGTEANFDSSFGKIKVLFDGWLTYLRGLWDSIGKPIWDIIQSCVDSARNAFAERMPEIQEFVSSCFTDIQDFWQNNLKPCFDAIKGFIENTLAPAFETVFNNVIGPVIDTVFGTIKDLWNNTLKPVFTGITDFLTGVFSGNWEQAWDGIVSVARGIFDGIVTVVKTPINLVIDLINGFIGGLNGLQVPDWVPGIGGKGINIPLIPKLEEGGILDKGQVGFLEGTGAEAVVPLDQNRAWINAVAKDMNMAIGGNNEDIKKLREDFKSFVDMLPEMLMDAFLNMKFDINNREFGRLVKAVN